MWLALLNARIAPRTLAGLLAIGCTLALTGCTLYESTCDANDRDCIDPLIGRGVGGECERIAECQEGLDCVEGTCQPTGNTDRGEKCRLTAECGDADYCGSRRVCAVAGNAKSGEE